MAISSLVLRWVFVLSAVGYALVAIAALSIGVESRPLSVGLRVSLGAICALAVLIFAREAISARPPMGLVIFLILYLARMLWDMPTIDGTEENLIFYLAVVLIPVCATILLADSWDDQASARTFAALGLLVSGMLIASSLFGWSEWRSTTENAAGRFSYDVLDPITVGNIGASTAIAGFCHFRAARQPWTLIAVCVGLICLIMGLSRGPILSLLICILLYFWLIRRFFILAVSVIIMLTLLSTGLVDHALDALRVSNLRDDVTANIRIFVIMSSIDQFLTSPLTGVSYLEKSTLNYPHNIFVESALAMGIGGLFLAIFLFVKSYLVGVKRARSGELFLFLMFVYWSVEVQFSGAIWSNVMLWLSMALILRGGAPRHRLSRARDLGIERRVIASRIGTR